MMYHTGGHPGYLSALLTKVIETRFTPAPDRFYQANIEIFIRLILKELSKRYAKQSVKLEKPISVLNFLVQ